MINRILLAIYESILHDDVNDFNVYHFTTIENLYSILNDGGIKVNKDPVISGGRVLDEFGHPTFGISTTRNKNLKWGYCNIRLVFDKRKLKNKYKIMPVHWFNMKNKLDSDKWDDNRKYGDITVRNNISVNQYEERVIADNIPLHFVKQIDIINNSNASELTQEDINKLKRLTDIPVVEYR